MTILEEKEDISNSILQRYYSSNNTYISNIERELERKSRIILNETIACDKPV